MTDSELPAFSAETPLQRIPFTPRDEASIRALCNWMQIAAIISIITGILKLVGAFMPQADLAKIFEAGLNLLLGVWIYQAGTNFRQVVASDKADQRYLADGFALLRRVFLVQAVLVLVLLAAMGVALLVVILLAAASGGGR